MCVGREGVEPSRYHYRRILSPLRLPIPPSPRQYNSTINQDSYLPGLACKYSVFCLYSGQITQEMLMPTVRDMIRKKGSEVYSIDPQASVYEALSMMSKQNTGALMVVSGKNVDGIL